MAVVCAVALAGHLSLASAASAASFPATPETLGDIPDGGGDSLVVDFPVSGLAPDAPVEVAVSVSMDHTWVSDLKAELVAPGGTRRTLFTKPGAFANENSNLDGTYTFSDRAPASPTLTGAVAQLDNDEVLPSESYRATSDQIGTIHSISSAFQGLATPNGTWQLEITDDFTTDSGSVTGATLNIVGSVSARPDSLGEVPNGIGPAEPGVHKDIIFDVSGLPLGAPADVAVSITAEHPWAGEFDVVLVDPELTPATVFSRTGATAASAPGSHSNLNGTYRFHDGAPEAPSWWTAAQNAAGADIPSGSYRSSSPGGDAGGGTTTSLTPAFAGLADPNGIWALQVRDFFSSADTGEITAASLRVVGGNDSTAPPAPDLLQTVPSSPSSSNTPNVRGDAEDGSMVRLYANGTCSGLATVVGTEAAFFGAGIPFPVADDSITTISATAYDTSGNVSACTPTALSYREDSTAPAPPSLAATDPPSPGNDDTPKITGSAEDASIVRFYKSSDCTGALADEGTAGLLNGPGIELNVAEDQSHTFRATATDEAGNVSDCSDPITYIEDSTAPATTASTPEARVKTPKRKATVPFTLGPKEPGTDFECSLDDGPFQACPRKPEFRLRPGRHTLEALATDAAQNADVSPAEATVKVVRKKPKG